MGDDKNFIIGAHAYIAPRLEPALYLVSTPIGNLKDITIRALEVLAGADIVACEDTRVSRILLERYAIRQRPFVYQEHNAQIAGRKLIEQMDQGQSVALISDAGTPLLSDPGFKLVEEARLAGHKVIPIPGASALLAALVATGLPTDSFLFHGFLPAKKSQRIKKLEEMVSFVMTIVFYESPHRVVECLDDMVEVFGAERQAALCRELTKTFETVDVARLDDLAQRYREQDRIRGEIVLVVHGRSDDSPYFSEEDVDRLLLELSRSMSAAKAAGEAARMTGRRKNILYQRLVALQDRQSG